MPDNDATLVDESDDPAGAEYWTMSRKYVITAPSICNGKMRE